MTVKELIEELQKYDENLEVVAVEFTNTGLNKHKIQSVYGKPENELAIVIGEAEYEQEFKDTQP